MPIYKNPSKFSDTILILIICFTMSACGSSGSSGSASSSTSSSAVSSEASSAVSSAASSSSSSVASSSSSSAPTQHAVSVHVTGTTSALEVRNTVGSGTPEPKITVDGAATFTAQDDGTTYLMDWTDPTSADPKSQIICLSANNSGTIHGNVTVEIFCDATKQVGGTISNLNGDITLSLSVTPPTGKYKGATERVSLTDEVTLNSGATTYAFTKGVLKDDGYAISMKTQPAGQVCELSVVPATGTVGTGNVVVDLICPPSSSSSISAASSSKSNTPPIITGTPTNNVSENRDYLFTPTASDSDGNILSFSISNKPSWASFNTVTGQLTGTPITTGHYPEIVISVSDGIATSSLPSFTIDVLGSAVLNWSKPTLNTDGTDLTDLTGYVVYYGTSPNTSELTKNIPISDGNTTSTTIEGLSIGTTYYFAVASISASGGEGKKSNPASKTIN